MPQNILLIVNPVSGKGKARSVLSGVVYALCRGGNAVTVVMTEYAGHGEKIVAQRGKNADVIACVGGDGTLSGVINGLMLLPPEERPRVGYIPLGTTNDMAVSFGIPRLPHVAARHIVEGTPKTVDVGSGSGGYFGYVMAFGAFVDIPFTTPQESKNAFGWLAYLAGGAASIQKLAPHHLVVEHDGGVLEGEYIFGAVSNSTSVAGLLKFPASEAVLDDGLFELLLVKHPKNPVELNAEIAGLLSQNYNNGELLTLLHTSHVRIIGDKPVIWTRDGENGGSHTVMEAHVCPKAMQIMG